MKKVLNALLLLSTFSLAACDFTKKKNDECSNNPPVFEPGDSNSEIGKNPEEIENTEEKNELLKDANGKLQNQNATVKDLYEGYMSNSLNYTSDSSNGNKSGFMGFALDVTTASDLSSANLKTTQEYMIVDYQKLMNSQATIINVFDTKAGGYGYSSDTLTELSETIGTKIKVDSNGSVGVGKDAISLGLSLDFESLSSKNETYNSQFSMYEWNLKCYKVSLTIDDYWDIISENFKDDIIDLNKGEKNPDEIINKYGTHILTSAYLGGYYNCYSYYYTEEYVEEKQFKVACQRDISYQFNVKGVVIGGSNSMDAEVDITNNLREKNIIKKSKCCYGGGTTKYLTASSTTEEINDWAETIAVNPTLTSIVDENSLKTIFSIIPDEYVNAKESLEEYYKKYVNHALLDFEEKYKVSNVSYNYGTEIAPKVNLDDFRMEDVSSNTKVLNLYLDPNTNVLNHNFKQINIPSNINTLNITFVGENNPNYIHNVQFNIENRESEFNINLNNTKFYAYADSLFMFNGNTNYNTNICFDGNVILESKSMYELYLDSMDKKYLSDINLFDPDFIGAGISQDSLLNPSATIIDGSNQTFTLFGSGFVKIKTGDGTQWTIGGNSGCAINARNLNINGTEEKIEFDIRSGNGQNGVNGNDSTTHESNGENGFCGGDSGNAINLSGNLIFKNCTSENIEFNVTSGDGGKGGNGGKGCGRDGSFGVTAKVSNGGDAGAGGDSRMAIYTTSILFENCGSNFINIRTGLAGNAGTPGNGATAQKWSGETISGSSGSPASNGIKGSTSNVFIDPFYLI